MVLGFPSNDFAGEEPEHEASIKAFCRRTFGVQFPMFAMININSAPRHPLNSALKF